MRPRSWLTIYIVLAVVARRSAEPANALDDAGQMGKTSSSSSTISLVINRVMQPKPQVLQEGTPTGGTCLWSNSAGTRYALAVPHRTGRGRRVAAIHTADTFSSNRCAPVYLAALPRRVGDGEVVLFLPLT